MALAGLDFGGIGQGVSSVFGGIGTLKGAKAYKVSAEYARKAAGYADENADIAASSERVKQLQVERNIYQVVGGQQADVAGAGFAASGSALDLLKSSQEQGALTKALVTQQGEIEQRGYRQEAEAKRAEAASYSAQASAAKTSGIGGILGGVLKVASAFPIFSDARLKHHIELLYRRPDGLGIYWFRYMAGDHTYQGVLAQEVAGLYPEAVMEDPNTGYMMVDYAAIGEQCLLVGAA